MSSLIGNAAAHRVLEPDRSFALLEALLYETQAKEEAEMRTWNEDEITPFRDGAQSYAKNVIKKRTGSHRGRTEESLVKEANQEVSKFIADEVVGKRKQRKRLKSGKEQGGKQAK